MNDHKFENQAPIPSDDDDRGALTRARSMARRGRKRVLGALRSRFSSLGDAVRDQALEVFANPEQVEILQQALANLTQWAINRGFRADPNAELLFHFVDWLEKRHDRQTVTMILLHSPMLHDPAFLDALTHLSQLLNPWEQADEETMWDSDQIEGFKKRAGDRLLDLLVELAALESDDPAPSAGSVDDRIAYFEDAPIPIRFTRLATMTQGERLIKSRPPSRRLRWVKNAIDRVGPNNSEPTGLTRFIPGLGDRTLHFLIFSTTFFLQSYLVRNLIEALPELAENLSEPLRGDDIIDVE